LLAGGNWNNLAHAGARAANVNNWPWQVNTNIGVRLACDLKKSAIFQTWYFTEYPHKTNFISQNY